MSTSENFDIALIQRRINLINDACNHAIQEITSTGRLRVPIEGAFTKPDELVKLIAYVCLLKQYATSAAQTHGQLMDLGAWNGWFNQFDQDCHILPSGKLS